MLELICVLAGITLLFLLFAQARPDDGIRAAVLAAAAWFALYAVVSVLLFAADIFTIRLAAGITDIGLAGAFTAWSWTKKKLSFRICFPFRKYALCFLILAVAMPFAAGKFGYFGMGQDEGVYQTHAIQLMYGENSRQLDFPEYTQLNMKEREACQDAVVSHLLGFYTVDEYGTISGYDTETMSRASGIFHGIPNYAAMLALSGRISGIAHMMDIQTVFYILSILLFFMITENLGWKRLTGGILTALLAFSPLLIWVTKSALTEGFQLMLILAFLYFMTENRSGSCLGAAAAVITFSFFHVVSVVYTPFFVLIFLIISWRRHSKCWALAGTGILVGIAAGIHVMTVVSPQYTYMNLGYSLYKILPFINNENVITVFWLAAIAGILCFLPAFLGKGLPEKLVLSEKVWGWFWRLAVIGWLAAEGYLLVKQQKSTDSFLTAFQNLQAGAFVYFSGIFTLPLAVSGILVRPQKAGTLSEKVLLAALLYCVMFYAAFLKTESREYYYYTRYIAPYLGIVLLAAGIYMDRLIRKSGWWKMAFAVCTVGVMFLMAPYLKVLAIGQDDTYIDWNTLEEVADGIEAEDAVLLESDQMRVFFFPVRAITGASVYCRTEDLSVLTRNLKKVTEGDIYYISDEKNLVEKSEGVCVFRKEYEISQDDGSDHGGWIPLPGSFTSSQAQISVYRCTGESRLEYNMADSLLALNGFGDLEGEFRWIRAQEASVSCRVEPGHYYLQIFCASVPPDFVMKNPQYYVEVYINHELVGSALPGTDQILQIELQPWQIPEGEFTLSIRSPLWPAAFIAEGDSRMLGLAVSRIIFMEKV